MGRSWRRTSPLQRRPSGSSWSCAARRRRRRCSSAPPPAAATTRGCWRSYARAPPAARCSAWAPSSGYGPSGIAWCLGSCPSRAPRRARCPTSCRWSSCSSSSTQPTACARASLRALASRGPPASACSSAAGCCSCRARGCSPSATAGACWASGRPGVARGHSAWHTTPGCCAGAWGRRRRGPAHTRPTTGRCEAALSACFFLTGRQEPS
mmetsp:Transcript_80540/g.249902  ORF Transcript_80540/g.249902 Transcript_80540/m.249902 type:complete len:210 (-) Transcript_80540:34-663(-)